MDKSVFQTIVYSPDKKLYAFLVKHLVMPDAEFFYLNNLSEVEKYANNIRPQVIVLYVSHELHQLKHTIELIDKLNKSGNYWFLLLTSPDLSSNTLQTAFPVKRVILQQFSNNYQQITHNLLLIRDLILSEQDQQIQQRFLGAFKEMLKKIFTTKDLSSMYKQLMVTLPKLIPAEYWLVFNLDEKAEKVACFSEFLPPAQNKRLILKDLVQQLANSLLNYRRITLLSKSENSDIFELFKRFGWEVNNAYFVPMQYRGTMFGGILLANSKPRQLLAKEVSFLSELTESLVERIKNDDLSKKQAQLTLQNFSNALISNHLNEKEIFRLTCEVLAHLTEADSAIFWQYNKGFGFMFPKYVYFQKYHEEIEYHERDMVFFEKEKHLSSLINRGKILTIEDIYSDKRLDKSTLSIFKKLNYRNLLIIPINVGKEVIGAIIVNKASEKAKFSISHITNSEEVSAITQQILVDAHTVREANRQIKQFSRIFELGRDIKLGLPLNTLLSRLNSNLRKTLGWNDVATLLLNEKGKKLVVINRIGFNTSQNYHINLNSGVTLKKFQEILKDAEKIGNSFFIKQHHEKETQQTQKHISLEWENGDLIAVPLDTRQDVLGYLLVSDPVDRLKPNIEKIMPLEYYANQAAVAVENVMLFEELKSSQERYRSLSETMSLGLVTCNAKSKIIYFNPAFGKMLGYSKKELLNTTLYKYFTENAQKNLQKITSTLLNTVTKDHVETHELDIVSKSGEVIPVKIYGFPFFERRKQTGYFLILNDLRVIKRLERMKADFNSMIVHDLRSPLNVIQGFVELIRNKVVGEINQEQEELLDIVKENVKKVLSLVDNFLITAKLEVGKLNIDLQSGDINSFLQRQIENHSILIKNKQIEIITKFDENIPTLAFDPLRIEQVVNNLLSNALKFTPEKGKIEVSTRLLKEKDQSGEDKLYACVSISDSGIGIPKEKLNLIFEKYQQIEDNQNFNLQGTGLGLSICKEIVELHHGKVWAESELNAGSTFYFTIPVGLEMSATQNLKHQSFNFANEINDETNEQI
jgi:PAS domain S-box-containing protein